MLTARFVLHIRSISDVDMISTEGAGNEAGARGSMSLASMQFNNRAVTESIGEGSETVRV